MNPIYQELKPIPPIRLHYAIGANCYQHVRGYNKTIVGIVPAPPEYALKAQMLHYFSLFPGNSSNLFNMFESRNEEVVKAFILQGCRDDGIVVLDGALETISDMTPGAVFFSKEKDGDPADFHFVVRKENGTWEDKTPLRDVHTYKELPRQIDGYKFSNFILVPDTMPKGLQKLKPEFQKITDGQISADLALVDYKSLDRGNKVYVSRKDSRAAVVNDFEKFEIPAPAYIPTH